METRIHIDFETRSQIGIDVGAYVYSLHPSTEPLCLAFAINGEPVEIIRREHMDVAGYHFNEYIKSGALFIAHYAGFEYYIWHNIMAKRYGAPPIPPRQWRCTAAKAAAMALPRSLDGVGKALNLKIQKDMEGKVNMMKMCKPRKPLKHEKEEDKFLGGTTPVRWYEAPEQFEQLYLYCKDDVDVEREVDNVLPDLSFAEQQVWFEDQELNRRGIQIDIPAVDAALQLIQEYTLESNKEVERLTNGELSKVTSPLNVLRWAKEKGVALPNFQKETVAAALKDGTIPPDVREILQIRTQMGKTSTAKYKKLKIGVDSKNILKEILVFCGAEKTGRFAGKQFQIHNLPRGELKNTNECVGILKWGDLEVFKFLYPEVMDAISACIRGMIIPRQGKEFVVIDWNAIEPRLLFWYANCVKGLEEYRLNFDLYVELAKKIFEKETINDLQRYIGKQGILLCGYGGGGKRRPDGEDSKFMSTCKKHGVDINDALSERAVNTYRTEFKEVPTAWYTTEKKAIEAVYTKLPVECYKVKWVYDQKMDFLFCYLPSGRRLVYYKPRIERGKLSVMRVEKFSFIRKTIWGGVLVQNIIEGLGRDIMVLRMQSAAKKGYPTVFHTHDELITEVKQGFGSVNELAQIVIEPPLWGQDIPLAAAGWRGNRYEKR